MHYEGERKRRRSRRQLIGGNGGNIRACGKAVI
jgi:hypothetical protein